MPTTTATAKREVTLLKNEVKAYLKKWGLDTDVTFYSKTKWRERGEPYGNEAVLSMTFEGPLYEALNYGEWGGYREGGAVDFFANVGQKYGLYFEQGYAWSGHFHDY